MTATVSMPAAALSYCPTCREYTVLQVGRACAWCDTTTIAPRSAARKRPGVPSRLTDNHIRALHVAHQNGHSLRSLARILHARGLYASENSGVEAIRYGFDRLHLKARDRIAATVAASTTHGLRPRTGPKPGYHELRQLRRLARGETHGRICAASRTQYPGKGQPCLVHAQSDSAYCYQHDPRHEQARAAHLAGARARKAATT